MVSTTLVDVVSVASVFVSGAPMTRFSVEINVSYVDFAYYGVSVSFLLSY